MAPILAPLIGIPLLKVYYLFVWEITLISTNLLVNPSGGYDLVVDEQKEKELKNLYWQVVFVQLVIHLFHQFWTTLKADASDLMNNCWQVSTVDGETTTLTLDEYYQQFTDIYG